ncbi:ubiquinone biosynthesis O-methyltransferase, mitochondrial [Spodoptera frugiperda]|uniref:Ubiquinone biosynthesis O-methyltransferase, mitochondrial n=1 Tax=Spodoptera frugiperda TaxID=7108 RepID=A0A9R0DF32_SPOFR|nr:ubiquinone biosynthesis O-methyltransferase, mitochondrial [Spodoptera frugiperda]
MSLWKLNKCIFDKSKTVVSSKVPQPGSKLSLRRNQTEVQNPPIGQSFNKDSTIDAADVKFFSQRMKEWWNPNGEFRLLHSMNLIRVPFVRDGLVSATKKDLHPLRDKKILDVGCGGGILSEGLARLGAAVTGIDASKELIEIAEHHKHVDPKIAENKPKYIHSTVEDHAKSTSNFYDGIVASEVIEHVNNQELFVKSCVHALKPGGRIFFTTPNRTRWSQFFVIFFAENVLKTIPQGAHQYEKFITPNELTFLLERNNCHVELTYGVTLNPVTGQWDFSQFQHLMYAIQAVKLS